MPCAPAVRVLTHKHPLMALDPASRRTIYDLLSPSDLRALSQVSFSLDDDIAGYWAHLVKALCFRFVPHPEALLSALRLYRGVLSGSAVLALLSRASWRPGDLDVYCPAELFEGLIFHFALVQGFQLQNPEVLELDDGNDLIHIPIVDANGYIDTRQILNVAHMRRGDVDIDIVQSASSSALSPLAAFWTTAVQNFVSPTVICVAYPVLTEANVGLLAPRYLVDLQLPTPRIINLIRKYENRGLRFAVRPYALTGSQTCAGQASSACAAAVRFFGDEHCIVVRTQGVRERAADEQSLALLKDDNVFWWRGGYTCGLECGALGMRVWPGMVIPPRDDQNDVDVD